MATQYSRVKSLLLLSILVFLERFSYFAIYSTSLIYFLDSRLFAMDISQIRFYREIFTVGIPLSALFIGLLVDKVLKQERAIFIGASIFIVAQGLFLLRLESLFIPIFILIAIGVNLLKPSFVVLIGRLFRKEEQRRDIAFLWYSIATNVGSFLSVFATGSYFTGDKLSWNIFILILITGNLICILLFYFIKDKLPIIETNTTESKVYKSDYDSMIDPILDADDSKRSKVVIIEAFEKNNYHRRRFGLLVLISVMMGFYLNLEAIGAQAYFGFLANNADRLTFFQDATTIDAGLDIFEMGLWMGLTILLFFIWNFVYIGGTISRILLSFVFLAIGTVGGYIMLNDTALEWINYWYLPLLLLGVSDAIMTPVVLSYITRLANTNYTTTILGGYQLILFAMAMSFSAVLNNTIRSEHLVAVIVSLGILIVLCFIFKRRILNLSEGIN